MEQVTPNSRALALDVLLEMEKTGEYSHVLLQKVLQKYNYLDTREKAFLKRLVEGTIERKTELDYCINSYSKIPVKKMKPLIRCLMRMSAYQLLFMDSVPDAAVCNEACKLAEKRGFHTLKGFVNGVLRSLARNKNQIAYPDQTKDPAEYLSVACSMEKWLVQELVNQYGVETTKTMLEGFLKERPVTIRFSETLQQKQMEAYLEAFEAQGVKTLKSQYYDRAIHLSNVGGVENLPGFMEGAFYVQDLSSMMAVLAAGIKEGDFVLDVCAAPGGKTMFASEKAKKAGKVVARDVTEHKTSLLLENAERMNCENVVVQCKDATIVEERMVKRADVVLADVPCSGLGILGRKPDIKYHCTMDSLKEITTLQRAILDTVWQYVKPGGILLYSTCTIRKEENEKQVAYLLEHYPFELEAFETGFAVPESAVCKKEGMCQLLPGFDETDGFFFAKLRRKTEE